MQFSLVVALPLSLLFSMIFVVTWISIPWGEQGKRRERVVRGERGEQGEQFALGESRKSSLHSGRAGRETRSQGRTHDKLC